MTPMTDNGLAALAQCGFVCGIPKDAHQTEEHPWEPLHHVAVGCPDAATIAALRTALDRLACYADAASDCPYPMHDPEKCDHRYILREEATLARAALATAKEMP